MTAMFSRVVAVAFTDAVALRKGAVHQYILRLLLRLTQGPGRSRRPAGQQRDDGADIAVGGADAGSKAGRDLGEGDVLTQVHQRDQGTSGRT
ncbi:UmuC protein [Streptomyces sp. NBRC 110611]|nr:UmuC protein [Streptomyces sp. NBRC 110611]GAU71645.1 UmuC protein [Streptomyces sp. NBRC 110611]